MTSSDKQFLDRLKSELDSDLENIDDATLVQLASNRRAALSGRSPPPALVVPFAPAFAFVATAVVLAILLRVPGSSREVMDPNMQLIEFSLAGAEMELVDDLDFFRWLDAHGNEG